MFKDYLGQTHPFTYARQLAVKELYSQYIYAHRNDRYELFCFFYIMSYNI